MKWIEVGFIKEGIHCFPGAKNLPGVEYLANEHSHYFYFTIKIEVYHNDREIEFLLFRRELEKLYNNNILTLNYKSCEMMADELADIIMEIYPKRKLVIKVAEDNINAAIGEYNND